jgi:predicted glycoside hydrolase/deacetylase ChbG (UPF0249 family)
MTPGIAAVLPRRLRRRGSSPHRSPLIPALLAVFLAPLNAAAEPPPAAELLIRCDDVGMCHGVNQGVRKLIATGIPFSASVMIACPWYLEAAEILRRNPQVSVGIHLTLNSEWQHYKWGPVLGASEVPTLVDENGHFHTTEADFAAAEVDLEEVRRELTAQIERARRAGLAVDYLDYHMLTAVSTPELRNLVEDLARRYGLGLSRYFGESSASIWDVPPEGKLQSLLRIVGAAKPGGLQLLVMHLGLEIPEMTALIDLNNPRDPFRVASHRQAELDAITSPAFRRAISERGMKLVTYRDVIRRNGLAAMARPEGPPGYSTGDEDP